MKKILSTVIIAILANLIVFSQATTFILKTGERIKAKRFYSLMPHDATVKYKTYKGDKKEINKTDIFCMIVGSRQLFVFDEKGGVRQGRILGNINEIDPNDSCTQAQIDAVRNYRIAGTAVSTGIISFLAWPVGLIVASANTAKPINESSLNIDTNNHPGNQYAVCYKKEASKKRNVSTWTAFGLGTSLGISVSTLIILLL